MNETKNIKFQSFHTILLHICLHHNQAVYSDMAVSSSHWRVIKLLVMQCALISRKTVNS